MRRVRGKWQGILPGLLPKHIIHYANTYYGKELSKFISLDVNTAKLLLTKYRFLDSLSALRSRSELMQLSACVTFSYPPTALQKAAFFRRIQADCNLNNYLAI